MLKVSFNFDETNASISGLKVENYTPKIKEINTPDDSICDVQVQENKLVISKSALERMNAKADDRISIQYWSEGVGKSSPLIGKAQAFTDRADGNRITSKGTVAFRGEKRATLVSFGEFFNLEDFKDGIWKLIPVKLNQDSDESLEQEEDDAENLNDKEIDNEIDTIINATDDLPF